MVRNGQRRLLELERTCDEILDAVGPVEEGIFGMAMQMNEGHTVRIGTGRCR